MKLKKLIVYSLFACLIWALAGICSALYLTSPNHQDSTIKGLTEITITTQDNLKISASYIKKSNDKVVILLAGIKGNRISNVSRIQNYLNKGYSILLPDLRATGKSEGNTISFGWNERKDLIACYKFLQTEGYKNIGAHGCSLGAATICYSLPETNFSFIVLESCYDNLEHAFENRVEKFHLPSFLFVPIHYSVERIISANIKDLKPEEFIKKATCPVLMMAGDSEDQLKISETHTLYYNCPSTNKTLHVFKGGKHQDFKARFLEEYEQTLNNFIPL
jgi:esterase/lipase